MSYESPNVGSLRDLQKLSSKHTRYSQSSIWTKPITNFLFNVVLDYSLRKEPKKLHPNHFELRSGTNYLEQTKEINENWSGPKIGDICFEVISDCY